MIQRESAHLTPAGCQYPDDLLSTPSSLVSMSYSFRYLAQPILLEYAG